MEGLGKKRKDREKSELGSKAKGRHQRRLLAQETVRILEDGMLQGQPIGNLVEGSVEGTLSYPEEATIPLPLKLDDKKITTRFSVVNTTTLDAAWCLAKNFPDEKVAVLNFASAKNPGGGFLNGSMAQEESLANHSGLYACLKGDKMYDHHHQMKGGIYTDWCIFSPDVPVFRRESNGSLISAPWLMSVISSPCLNRSAKKGVSAGAMATNELKEAIRKRMMRFLSVLAAHHSVNLVLGAWGCGVFANDPLMIAILFADLLTRHPLFQNRWPNVVFAVLDSSREGSTISPFSQAFGGSSSLS